MPASGSTPALSAPPRVWAKASGAVLAGGLLTALVLKGLSLLFGAAAGEPGAARLSQSLLQFLPLTALQAIYAVLSVAVWFALWWRGMKADLSLGLYLLLLIPIVFSFGGVIAHAADIAAAPSTFVPLLALVLLAPWRDGLPLKGAKLAALGAITLGFAPQGAVLPLALLLLAATRSKLLSPLAGVAFTVLGFGVGAMACALLVGYQGWDFRLPNLTVLMTAAAPFYAFLPLAALFWGMGSAAWACALWFSLQKGQETSRRKEVLALTLAALLPPLMAAFLSEGALAALLFWPVTVGFFALWQAVVRRQAIS